MENENNNNNNVNENNTSVFYNVNNTPNGEIKVDKVVYEQPGQEITSTPQVEQSSSFESAPQITSEITQESTPSVEEATTPSVPKDYFDTNTSEDTYRMNNETVSTTPSYAPPAPPVQQYKEPEQPTPSYREEKEKPHVLKKILPILLVILVIGTISFLTITFIFGGPKKNRTFMIYMVGSDLESNGSFGTYDLEDVVNANIDLDNNNVILMVGGSKEWHNFVDADEIGLYRLEKDGFTKITDYPVSSMGSSENLTKFLNYSHNKYPAKEYDLIFWNHGLGSVGLEDDELSEDFLNIEELDIALKNSYFNNEKLEVVIFNNCLAGNIHFATVMSKYANYMVGSEEVMYVASIIDRLNFIGDVTLNDNGFSTAKHYVDKTDASMNFLNSVSVEQYDSTLAVIDLSKIDALNNSINKFFESLNVDQNYFNVTRARMMLHTYSGDADYVYDTVDLYELVEALKPFSSDQRIAEELKGNLQAAVKYNSALNSHSNGLSIYFPFYGNTNYIEAHLYYFGRLWNNSYLDFITNYYETNANKRRSYRAATGSEINKLTNAVVIEENNISLELTDEEKDNYQRANIYLFEKDEDSYNLVLKSNKLELVDNTLSFSYTGTLKTANGDKVSLYDEDKATIYSVINNIDSISNITIGDEIKIIGSIYDSGEKPTIGIVEDKGAPSALYKVKYNLFKEDTLDENWKDNNKKTSVPYNAEQGLKYELDDVNQYVVLIELYDLNNDAFYTNLEK